LPETGTVPAPAAREAIGRRRLHQDQNSRTEIYLLGAVASMRARTVGAPCEAYPVPEAVIFELDGVLLDSEPLWNRAEEQLTRCSGGRWHEDAPTVMLGMSSPEWARYLHDELAVPLDPQEINRQVVRRMQELYREQLPLLPEALDVVHALRQRWPLGLASFSNREIIELLLELGELAGTFAATVSSEEVARVRAIALVLGIMDLPSGPTVSIGKLPETVARRKSRNRGFPENRLFQGLIRSGRRVSNPRPSAWEADALPTELRPR
jgi:hypothetical protein